MDIAKKTALLAIITLVADFSKDTAAALQPEKSILEKLAAYQNLIGDVTKLLPQLGQVGAEVVGLTPTDIVELVAELVTELAITDVKAQAIVQASLDLLAELAGPVLAKVETLVAAVKA